MNYEKRIQTLQESIAIMEKQISETTESAITENLKSKKTDYESELRRLIRLQYEEDTQRVHFDDDR